MREKFSYRYTLDRLERMYPGKTFLTYEEIGKFVGCSKGTAYRRFKPIRTKSGVNINDLARALCR